MALAPVEPLYPTRRASRAGVAELFGIALGSVDAWVRRGCPVVQRGRRGIPWVFDLLAVARWRFSPEAPAVVGPEGMTPRERRDWYDSERLRLVTEREAGRLLDVEDVRETFAAAIKAMVASLDTLPDVLERDVGLSPQAVARAIEAVDRLRDDLHHRLGVVAGVE